MNPLRTVGDTAREALYVAVGFGVLGVNRAQVERRQLTSKLSGLRSGVTRHVVSTPFAGPLKVFGVRPPRS